MLGRNGAEEEEDWALAGRAIRLVLNNRYAEAESLFRHRADSIQLQAGHCYVLFMNALMTFEEDVLEEATGSLRELEKKCAQDLGWLKTMRNKVFGPAKEKSEAASLEEQIVLADVQVCLALLAVVGGDARGALVRGGWALRKAWRLYHHTYTSLLQHYRIAFGVDAQLPGSDTPSWRVIQRGGTPESPSCPWSVPATPASTPASTPTNGYRLNPFSAFFSNSHQPTRMEPSVVARLMSAISFGYGLFHLCISLLPATLLRLVQLLGFAGDRTVGLEALMFSRQGPDMRAPLATLALLWYHTIVRPLLGVDNGRSEGGAEAAALLLEASPEFSHSALFLFFSGKVSRLKNEINKAVETYSLAVETSGQRELQVLCLHEVAWCRLIQLDLPLAYSAFLQLKHSALWGKPFYSYLTALCGGALGDTKVVGNLAKRLGGGGEDALAVLVRRRAPFITPDFPPPYFRLLIYELLYLWNDLPSTNINSIISDLEAWTEGVEEPMVGLRSLVMGACLALIKQNEEAMVTLRSAIVQRSALPPSQTDDHIAAFASYELASLLIKEPQTLEGGKKLLVQTQTLYKDYDCENRLSIRIHIALREAGLHC